MVVLCRRKSDCDGDTISNQLAVTFQLALAKGGSRLSEDRPVGPNVAMLPSVFVA